MALIKHRQPKTNNRLSDYPDWLQGVLANRGIESASELDYQLKALPNPKQMKGAQQAAKILAQALSQQQRLLIIADYDVDGATSCCLMLLALRQMGAASVHYMVPDRFKLGYGLSPAVVELAKAHAPDWLITVDNGIASLDGVRAAKRADMGVIITDHHLPGERLPEADVIVNPNQPDCEFPSKALAGVGVAFYVMLALRAELRANDWFVQQSIDEPNLAQLLDLVCLGSVADLVPLDFLNRCLIAQGLQRINAGQCRPGIVELLNFRNSLEADVTPQDLGFTVAPRLNAAGRLNDMTVGIECLLSETAEGARPIAEELNRLNLERRSIQDQMEQQARKIIDKQLQHTPDTKVVCLYSKQWHEGVVGLVASKIKDRCYRPTIAFAQADEEGLLKGSARSIQGIHIRDVLDRVATLEPEVLQKFGGHAMAAGLSIKETHLQRFERCINKVVSDWIDATVFDNIIWSDGTLHGSNISLHSAQQIQAMAPWGQRFVEPSFDGQFDVINWQVLKQRHLKFRLQLGDYGMVDAIIFGVDDELLYRHFERIEIVYRLNINTFRGQSRLQLMIDYLKPL